MRCDVLLFSCFHFVPKTYGFLSEFSVTNGIFPNTLHSTKLLPTSGSSLVFNPNEFITNIPPNHSKPSSRSCFGRCWESDSSVKGPVCFCWGFVILQSSSQNGYSSKHVYVFKLLFFITTKRQTWWHSICSCVMLRQMVQILMGSQLTSSGWESGNAING